MPIEKITQGVEVAFVNDVVVIAASVAVSKFAFEEIGKILSYLLTRSGPLCE
jgi:hypothetical protein